MSLIIDIFSYILIFSIGLIIGFFVGYIYIDEDDINEQSH